MHRDLFMPFINLLKLESDCDRVGEGESEMVMGGLASLNVKTNVAEAEGVGLLSFFRDISAKVFA